MWSKFGNVTPALSGSRKHLNNGNQHHVHVGYVKLTFTDLVSFDIDSQISFLFKNCKKRRTKQQGFIASLTLISVFVKSSYF